MKRLKTALLRALLLFSMPISAGAQSVELQAISDFGNLESGVVPYYLDTVADLNVLAINAANPSYRNKFARAEHTYTGASGLYDITIKALGEIDGDCTYQLLVNGVIQGTAVNPPVTEDYEVIEHTFQGIALSHQDVIAVESNAVSNDMIPEGDGYAFARGRWRSVTIEDHVEDQAATVTSSDLTVKLIVTSSPKSVGSQVMFNAQATNNSSDTTATNASINIALPDELEFISSDSCTATQAGLSCPLPNIAPEESTDVAVTVLITDEGTANIDASVSADQVDTDLSNNSFTLSFDTYVEVIEQESESEENTTNVIDGNDNEQNSGVDSSTTTNVETDTLTVETETEISAIPTTTTDNTSNSKSGATGYPAILLLMAYALIRRTRR